MHPQLRAIADTQRHLFTRAQAVASGYTERELRTHTAVHGPWVIVRRGVYVERAVWDALDPYDDQARLRDRAVHLTMRTPHLMSHDSAARALGIPMLRPRAELSHVTREGVGGTRTERGVKHHLTRLGLLNTVQVDGMRVTGPVRTALDLAREHGVVAGLIAADWCLHHGWSRRDLESELLVMWCWPNVTHAKAAVDLADAGGETIGETLTRILVRELGIGVPETQFPVRLGTGVAWTDLRVGCHVFEFDGEIKLRSVDAGGVATKPVDQVLREERSRQTAICGEGLGMSRVVWADLFGARRQVTKRRLAREYAVSLARFGDVLPPHLAAFAAQMRGRRRSA